ncbi:antitoxin [Haloechinothrix sp. YIM 98757]|uniref:Antitoxin n=1 Tax=Haloechinothrix aidingensis TaxID=2752311 RepID=A0A838A6Y9_9PSEU|nr:ribbon-helix-helix domain-containing protein [Haloechinothrix aidingensis]MBA0123999.1 antitoxin [Haloechinothrix aidingensis]
MTKQIAIRLPDELVEFIDEAVAHGEAASRAELVGQAVERERRREIAARDAAILARTGPDADLDDLARFAAQTPLDDLG